MKKHHPGEKCWGQINDTGFGSLVNAFPCWLFAELEGPSPVWAFCLKNNSSARIQRSCWYWYLVALRSWKVSFPGGSVVKNPPANSRDAGSIPDLGGSHVPWSSKPVRLNYRACALELGAATYWGPHVLWTHTSQEEISSPWETRAPQLEKKSQHS